MKLPDINPPDDQPVTWGELREVTRLIVQYQMNTTLRTIEAMSGASQSRLGADGTRAESVAAQAMSELGKELERISPGSTGA